jgi:hypothetical protein
MYEVAIPLQRTPYYLMEGAVGVYVLTAYLSCALFGPRCEVESRLFLVIRGWRSTQLMPLLHVIWVC